MNNKLISGKFETMSMQLHPGTLQSIQPGRAMPIQPGRGIPIQLSRKMALQPGRSMPMQTGRGIILQNGKVHNDSSQHISEKSVLTQPQLRQVPVEQTVVRDRSQPIGKWANVLPNNTVYVNNVNEKLKREELVQSLRHVFGQFGNILDIVCYTKILKAKGQAFIVFDQLGPAKKAVQEMQNFQFYNKPIRVSFAKSKSDIIAKRDGTYKPREKRPREKSKSNFEKGSKEKKQMTSITIEKPSKILKVSKLPSQSNTIMVQMLFRKFPGFQAVSSPKNGECLISFKSETDAQRAKIGMNGFKFTNADQLKIQFYIEIPGNELKS